MFLDNVEQRDCKLHDGVRKDAFLKAFKPAVDLVSAYVCPGLGVSGQPGIVEFHAWKVLTREGLYPQLATIEQRPFDRSTTGGVTLLRLLWPQPDMVDVLDDTLHREHEVAGRHVTVRSESPSSAPSAPGDT